MTRVYLEIGKRRVFASAAEWPGWTRSGKDEQSALEALAAAAPRYAQAAKAARIAFAPGAGFVVVERLPGDATTEFGAPGAIAKGEMKRLTKKEAWRLSALVAASWTLLDRVVENAPPALRKGPRGGGRDRDAIVEHVVGAETMYARKIGLRLQQPAAGDAAALRDFRNEIVAGLRAGTKGVTERGWPARYAARRMAWHVLDHAWEIEDRAT
ncbi:MAG TPA: hypothetical protein VHW94_13530 [Candidatus Dormibacteraeota bacterium]|nr:hypothetical protein [Candidatus Dormibacteraeota bacterium]